MTDPVIYYEHATHHLYAVRKAADGTYFAVRTENPCFCFHANSMTELVEKVEAAFKFHFKLNKMERQPVKKYPKQLADLVGEGVLETVPCMDARHPLDPDANGVLFTLSGQTFMVFEDANDGYRSSAGPLISFEGGVHEIGCGRFWPVSIQEPVICTLTEVDDILEMRSKETGIVIFSVGTSNVDDYYPSFECHWTPEGLSKNAKRRL